MKSQIYPSMIPTSSIQPNPLDHIHADVPVKAEAPRQKTKHLLLLLYEFVLFVIIHKPNKAPSQGICIQRINTLVDESLVWDSKVGRNNWICFSRLDKLAWRSG